MEHALVVYGEWRFSRASNSLSKQLFPCHQLIFSCKTQLWTKLFTIALVKIQSIFFVYFHKRRS